MITVVMTIRGMLASGEWVDVANKHETFLSLDAWQAVKHQVHHKTMVQLRDSDWYHCGDFIFYPKNFFSFQVIFDVKNYPGL